MARLEGAFEQIDKRLSELRDDLGGRIDGLERRLERVEGRMDMVLYGLAVAILVPIFLRVVFH